MPQTITLTQARVYNIQIDVARRWLVATYALADASGQQYKRGSVIFCESLPDPRPPTQDNAIWEVLMPAEVTALTTLVQRVNARVQQEVA